MFLLFALYLVIGRLSMNEHRLIIHLILKSMFNSMTNYSITCSGSFYVVRCYLFFKIE